MHFRIVIPCSQARDKTEGKEARNFNNNIDKHAGPSPAKCSVQASCARASIGNAYTCRARIYRAQARCDLIHKVKQTSISSDMQGQNFRQCNKLMLPCVLVLYNHSDDRELDKLDNVRTLLEQNTRTLLSIRYCNARLYFN